MVILPTYLVQVIAVIGAAFAALLIAAGALNADVVQVLLSSAFLFFTAYAFDATANDRATMRGQRSYR